MRKRIKLFAIATMLVVGGVLIAWDQDLFHGQMKAASSYTTGDRVYIGNDSYTVIDPSTMTLLKDTATNAGNVTWDDAVTSLSNLPALYGELGSKFVYNNFTLPQANDLALITNNDTLTTIDPISSDWWLGDASVDNRSKFVGANTNSLVTDVPIIKNIVDSSNTCLLDQNVTDQGIKPTKSEKDSDLSYKKWIPYATWQASKSGYSADVYSDSQCSNKIGTSILPALVKIEVDGTSNPSSIFYSTPYSNDLNNFFPYYTLAEYGGDDYLKQCIGDGSNITANLIEPATCPNDSSLQLGQPRIPILPSGVGVNECVKTNNNPFGVGSFKYTGISGVFYRLRELSVPHETTLSCPGHAQIAGISSVRPLLTVNKNKLAYSSVTKPTFNRSALLNQPVPEVNGNGSYLTITDADLGIALDSGNPDVSGNTLTTDRNNVSIPVSLSGTTSGTRYVSAVATTNSGDQYSVLGQVNGTTGSVQLDISNFPNYQSARTLSLTLYQEVDEGTNTTYRGNGTQITLAFSADPITAINFKPNYPNGKNSWTEGDAGIDTAGAKTGSFTFTGGTSGVNDPVSGKDYQKWEIVDASGNPTSDANFSITNNELIAKKKISAGTYPLRVKVTDNENETFVDTITITVVGYPVPTLLYNPISSNLTYGDNPTKVNSTIGTFSLQYPAGQPTSTIKTIQLGTGGDEAHFSIDTSGNLKVKGTDLNAGTYSVSVSGTDANGMAFSKTVSIAVAKKDQNNYQITNNTNYSFQLNQEINITTSGNDSGESETYTITNGTNVAQISNTTKFKMLDSGTFTLEATVGGNTNYNAKTVSKQITISQLPTQNPPVSITSQSSMVYGDTYSPSYSGGQGSGAISWSIENDNGTGAVISNGTITVTGVGSFTLKVTKAGDTNVQASSDTKVITVNKRKTIVKPKDVTKSVGQVFKDNGATYTPPIINGDNVGTLMITSKYPSNQAPGRYTDGIQASGLSNPNYDFIYQDGTLIINSNNLPNNGSGYYTVSGTKGKNNWYVSDVLISTTGKDGYTEISSDGISFQTAALIYSTDGDYPANFYLRNPNTGVISQSLRYQLKIDQTPHDVPTLTMKNINQNFFARAINALSFGNWMNQAAQITMSSTDATSGMDHYEYEETSQSGTITKTSVTGVVTYRNEIEITVAAKACDKAGNCSVLSNSEGVMIDMKAPTITGVKDKNVYKHYYLPRFVNVKDDYSGLSYSEYKKDGVMAGTIQNDVDERIDDIGDYEVYAVDNAGNEITITFKLVPLPDIETEIDGSDESKKIIDQVIDEYEDVKRKLDESEKQDYEQWIKDALDKWNSLRKKVVETDDQSAKIEGQGDTTFDPRVELIVEEISEDDIPKLPKKALVVYDVYLRKGMTKIQPDGKIKVYLPYADLVMGEAMGGAMDSMAEPIVYEIDENDHIKQLSVQREGSFVTFITNKLVKYAISNTDQPDNDRCPLEGVEINIDSDGDGNPDVNIDVDGDCKADVNIDTDDDGQPDVDIDTDLDGKPDYNVDSDGDGKADINVGPINEPFKPTLCKTVKGLYYCSDPYRKPYLNIDSDNDGRPDINVDLDGDGEADINIDVDGDLIPDLDIDSDGDGKGDINIDIDHDGEPDKNLLILSEWKPDKNVDGKILYDTMGGLLERLKQQGNTDQGVGSLGGANNNVKTGDVSKPLFWWILVIIDMIFMIICCRKVRKEKQAQRKAKN